MNLKSVIEELKMEINGFYTESIAFRLFTRSDAFPLYQATLNPKFNEKLAWGPPTCFADVLVQSDLLVREMNSSQSLVTSLVEKDTGTWLGLIKFSTYKDSVIKSLWLHPNFWNNPTVLVGSSAAVDIIFKATPLRKIYAKHAIGHVITEKILRKHGFKYLYNEPVTHSNGTLVDCKTYELTYENWQGKSKADLFKY